MFSYRRLMPIFAASAMVAAAAVPSRSQAQTPAPAQCKTTVDCAQTAVGVASKALAALKATQGQIDALKAQLDALKVKSAGPPEDPKRIDDTQLQTKNDGNLEYSLRCPAGQVAVGVDLLLGGTCHDYCTGNGHPVERFKVVCQPLEVAKEAAK